MCVRNLLLTDRNQVYVAAVTDIKSRRAVLLTDMNEVYVCRSHRHECSVRVLQSLTATNQVYVCRSVCCKSTCAAAIAHTHTRTHKLMHHMHACRTRIQKHQETAKVRAGRRRIRYCSVLQRVAVSQCVFPPKERVWRREVKYSSMSERFAMCCSVLQRVAAYFSAKGRAERPRIRDCSVLQ